MTLDNIMMLLADKKVLRGSDGRRTVSMSAVEVAATTSDGRVRGRAADGTTIFGKIGGKSMAQIIRERDEAAIKEQEEKEQRKGRRRGRRRHGN